MAISTVLSSLLLCLYLGMTFLDVSAAATTPPYAALLLISQTPALAIILLRPWLSPFVAIGYGLANPLLHLLILVLEEYTPGCGSSGLFPSHFCHLRLEAHDDIPLAWVTTPAYCILLNQLLDLPPLVSLLPNLSLSLFCAHLIHKYSNPASDWSLSVLSSSLLLLYALFATSLKPRPALLAPPPDTTLVQNALHISFPNNVVHESFTAQRIARALAALPPALAASMVVLAPGTLEPVPAPPPRHLHDSRALLYSGNVGPRACALKTLANVEALDDADLAELTRVMARATGLAPLPPLLRTLGCCWNPAIVIAEELPPKAVTLAQVASRMRRNNVTLDWILFQPLAVSLAQCLAALHRQGVCHREVFLDNIYLTSSTSVSLGPLGFLHCIPEARRKIIGSAFPVAPETVGHPQRFSPASDVWSLGVVCWEMLIGPFSLVTPLAMPLTVPARVADVIFDAIKEDPESRPRAKEMVDAFARAARSPRVHVASQKIFDDMCAKLA